MGRIQWWSALLLVAAVLGGAGGWYWWRERTHAPAGPPGPEPAATTLAAPPPPAITASAPAAAYPLDAPAPASGTAAPSIEPALVELFGRKSVLALFQVDGFVRRVVTTVDNLGRENAPPHLWPVNPADGRFLVERVGPGEVISADNGLRYTPFVLLIETVDLRRAVAVYTRHYPQFQQAYEELGYPGRYFNDRLVDVIDQLLATPEFPGPIAVRLPTINGPVQPQRPWLLYDFEDPALQSLSAGQKILLRTGPVNERRLKAKLAELRRLLATGAPGR